MSDDRDPTTADLHFLAGPYETEDGWYATAYWATLVGHPDTGMPAFLPYGDPHIIGPMSHDEAEAICRFVYAIVRAHDENMHAIGEAKFGQ